MSESAPLAANDHAVASYSAAAAGFGKRRILLYTIGSRGDTQPYCAFAQALKARGHAVAIAVERRLEPLVREFGLEYYEIYGDATGALWEPKYQQTYVCVRLCSDML